MSAWFPHSPRLFSPNLRVNYYANLSYFKCRCCMKFHCFILSAKCQVVITSFSLLTTLILRLLDLLSVSVHTVYRMVPRVITPFLLRRICLITTVKSGHYFQLTHSQNVKRAYGVFNESPLWVEKNLRRDDGYPAF